MLRFMEALRRLLGGDTMTRLYLVVVGLGDARADYVLNAEASPGRVEKLLRQHIAGSDTLVYRDGDGVVVARAIAAGDLDAVWNAADELYYDVVDALKKEGIKYVYETATTPEDIAKTAAERLSLGLSKSPDSPSIEEDEELAEWSYNSVTSSIASRETSSSSYAAYYSSSYREPRAELLGGRLVAGSCDALDGRDVDVRIVLEEAYCTSGDPCVPIRDYSVEPPSYIAYAVAAVLDALEAGKRVGVCCLGGCGRTGTVVSAVLAIVERLEASEAMKKYTAAITKGTASKRTSKECPETSEQRNIVRFIARAAREQGVEKTLAVLALAEKPGVLIVDGIKVKCRAATMPVMGRLTELVARAMKRRGGIKEVSIDSEEARRLLGDLYDVARIFCEETA